MKKILLAILLAVLAIQGNAQKKNVLLDISHERMEEYTNVNPHIFEQYRDIVDDKTGANLIINKDKEVDETLLAGTDLLIILSPLKRDRETTKNNLTPLKSKPSYSI